MSLFNKPGGLSLNTGSTGGSLFGGGASTSSSQPQQSGGLFGSSTANPSQPQTGGGLFGSATQKPGGLFGSSTTTSSQPQTGGGLFGGGQTQNQSQPQQSTGGGLFGGSAATTQNKPSLLGTSTTTSTQQPQQPSSLFGGAASTAQAQPQKPSLFGNTTTTQPGQPSAQTGGTVPGVKIDVSNLRGTTRFNDLHEELQKQIEQIDNFILQQMQYKDQCDALMPKHEEALSYIPNDVNYVSQRFETLQRALENDAQAVDHVRKLVKRDAADARLSFRAIDNLKLPQQYHYTGMWNSTTGIASSRTGAAPGAGADGKKAEDAALEDDEIAGTGPRSADLVSYFSAQADDMKRTLASYTSTVQEIESHLRGVEASTMQQMQQLLFTRGRDGGQRSAEDQIRELAAVLKEFEAGIFGVAGKVGSARENVQEAILGSSNAVGGGSAANVPGYGMGFSSRGGIY
ncbi:hypothetical protein L228DRAFT_263665 [Xylona heveae TC161]|uniref:Nucleoporin NUP49/NSP49 n=1 Tax=Xylona heveae (strain CBS 132557 / TC161) TaxID=1328760 RepID=A0A164ZNS9_XYLHT|nr:hypothetical protein L228DRAFT_263665 [Xylona heveae TC161]KZF19321.1 hypothetical protein L228DRAFT_263665 [Xylona heveae TC161]